MFSNPPLDRYTRSSIFRLAVTFFASYCIALHITRRFQHWESFIFVVYYVLSSCVRHASPCFFYFLLHQQATGHWRGLFCLYFTHFTAFFVFASSELSMLVVCLFVSWWSPPCICCLTFFPFLYITVLHAILHLKVKGRYILGGQFIRGWLLSSIQLQCFI